MTPRFIQIVLGKANPDNMNGVSRMVHTLAEALQNSGQSVEVWGITPDVASATPDRSYPLQLFPRQRNRFAVPPEMLTRLEGVSSSDILHFHGVMIPEFWGISRYAQKRGIPWVVTPHGALMPSALERNRWIKRAYIAAFERRFLREARTLHALCAPEVAAIERAVAHRRIVEVTNGISSSELKAIRFDAPALKSDKPLSVGYLGRLDSRQKGLDLLIEGFALYTAEGGNARLLIAGDGQDRAALTKLAEARGLSDRVTFLGAVKGSAKTAFFDEIDCFVHSSRWEGVSVAIIEALAHGKPVLVSTETNVGGYVTSSGSGHVLGENTPRQIADGLALLTRAAKDGRLNDMAVAARWLAETEFAWDRLADRIVDEIYSKPS